jgi:hypothetical protein
MTSNLNDMQGVRMADKGNGRQGVGQENGMTSNLSDRQRVRMADKGNGRQGVWQEKRVKGWERDRQAMHERGRHGNWSEREREKECGRKEEWQATWATGKRWETAGIGAEGTGRQGVWQESGVKGRERDRQVVSMADKVNKRQGMWQEKAGKGMETDRQRVSGRHREWVWYLRGRYMCHIYIF